MIKTIVGVDPGVSGAIAIIRITGVHMIIDMPTINLTKSKRQVAPTALASFLKVNIPKSDEAHVFIEKVHTMPEQGVASSGAFMCGFGMIIGVVAALGLPYTLVTPQRWKKVMLADLGKSKDMARERAMMLYPKLADYFKRVKDDGRAEALLIADYGRRDIMKKIDTSCKTR